MVSNDVPEQAWDDVQAGFCSPRTMEILARELETPNWKKLQNVGGDSRIIEGVNKDSFQEGK